MGISDLLGGLSFSDAATAFGQGWLDEDKAIKQAKAVAAQEEKEKNKVWLDAAVTSWTNPENSATNKLLYDGYGWTADTIMEDPKNYLTMFNLLYTPKGEKPNEADAISKILDNENIQPILNQIQEKMGKDFENILSDPEAARTFIGLYGQATSSAPEDSNQTIEDFRKLLTSENKETQVAFEKLFGEKIDKTATHPVMSGKTFTAEEIATNDQVAMKALNIWNNMVDLDEEESKGKATGFSWKSTPNEDSPNYVEIPNYKTSKNLNDITSNDTVISNWLTTDEAKDFISKFNQGGILSNEEATSFANMVTTHLTDWQNIPTYAKLEVPQEGSPSRFELKESSVYETLPPYLQNYVLDHQRNLTVKKFMENHGKKVGIVGQTMNGTTIIHPLNEENQNQPWQKFGVTPKQVNNYEILARTLGYGNRQALWNNQPDLLDNGMNPALDLAAQIILDDRLKTYITQQGKQGAYTFALQKDFGQWSYDTKQIVMSHLRNSNLEIEDQIRTLGILMREDVSKYLSDDTGDIFAQGATEEQLAEVLSKKVNSLFPDPTRLSFYRNQVAAGSKLIQLFNQYTDIISRTDAEGGYLIDVGTLGSIKEFWNNVFVHDESMYNRITSAFAGGGNSLGSAEQDADDFIGIIMAGDSYQSGSLKSAGEHYTYTNLQGEEVVVENRVIERLRHDLKKSFGAKPNDVSFLYGQKRALELYIAYTMARVFDDNGRISNYDLQLQLDAFSGKWDSNIQTARGAISIANQVVKQQHAIASALTGTLDPERGFTASVNNADGKKVSYLTTAPIARVNAGYAFQQMLGVGEEGQSGFFNNNNHEDFNVNKKLADPYGSYTVVQTKGTLDDLPVSKVVLADKNIDMWSGLPLYVIKGPENTWTKIPWEDNDQVVFAETESTSKGKTTFDNLPNFVSRKGKLVYEGEDIINIGDNITIKKNDEIDMGNKDLINQLTKHFEGVSE